jgi:hypothetical protein
MEKELTIHVETDPPEMPETPETPETQLADKVDALTPRLDHLVGDV